MTDKQAAELEHEFEIVFPTNYRRSITTSYPFSDPTEELDTDAESLRKSNNGCRIDNPWGFQWQPSYWCIGGDGAGGFYFIDTMLDDSTVFYCDHEDMPESIQDRERLRVISFQEFIEDILKDEREMEKWNSEMKRRIANRKWWQFWIPKMWPPKSME